MDHTRHSPYSQPGRHRSLLEAVDPHPAAISQVCRSLIGHYRAEQEQLPAGTVDDIHSRWLEVLLDRAVERQAGPLQAPRGRHARVQGCCRDHALLAVSILRAHGVPARSRVGFTNYFDQGWHHDHVVPEYHDGQRWVRFEPMLDEGGLVGDPLDLRQDVDPRHEVGFVPASAVWLAHVDHGLDLSRFGVAPEVPDVGGELFVRSYILVEAAHRHGDELLLWDSWGMMEDERSPEGDAVVERVARLLIAADGGDLVAEQELEVLYRADLRLHPGDQVLRFDPLGGPPVVESLLRG